MFNTSKASPILLKDNFIRIAIISIRNFQFSELPEKWITLRKVAMHVAHRISPIKSYQVDVIIKNIALYTYQANAFRNSFQKLAVGSWLKLRVGPQLA